MEYGEAVKWYRMSAEISKELRQPEAGTDAMNLGLGLKKAGELREALQWYDLAEKLTPSLAARDIPHNRRMLLSAMSDWTGTKGEYEDILNERVPLQRGRIVTIRGLQARPELNGRQGEVQKNEPNAEGRWAIRLLPQRNGDAQNDAPFVNVKRINLRVSGILSPDMLRGA